MDSGLRRHDELVNKFVIVERSAVGWNACGSDERALCDVKLSRESLISFGQGLRFDRSFFDSSRVADVTIDQFIRIVNFYIRWHDEKRIKIALGSLRPLKIRGSLGITA